MDPLLELNFHLRRWQNRLRLLRALKGLFYGLASAAGAGTLLSIYAAWSQNLLPEEYLRAAGVSLFALAILGAGLGYLWPQRTLEMARWFDRLFRLKERVSTALELNRPGKTGTFHNDQLSDALRFAEMVDVRQGLRFKIPVVPASILILLLAGNIAFWHFGQDYFERAQQKRSILATIEQQAEEIERLIEQISKNPDLTESQKEDLIDPLDQALENLAEAQTLEQAFSALEEAQEQLQALQNPDAELLAEALQQAGIALSEQGSEDFTALADGLANGDFNQAADALRQIETSNLNTDALESLAQSLEDLAASVAAQEPDLAAELREAAAAARAGDAQAAQQALGQAAQALDDLQAELAASEAAQQASGQLQDSQSAVVAAGQGAGNRSANTSGSQGSQEAAGGSGAGEGTGNQDGQAGSEAGSDPIGQGNSPDGAGEAAFQPISPSSLGGSEGDRIAVPPSGIEGDTITGVGPSDPGSSAPVTVPYTEVFPQYQSAANQAIDNGTIPPQYRDLIRDYFSSLEP